jgi:hypothetical protein
MFLHLRGLFLFHETISHPNDTLAAGTNSSIVRYQDKR